MFPAKGTGRTGPPDKKGPGRGMRRMRHSKGAKEAFKAGIGRQGKDPRRQRRTWEESERSIVSRSWGKPEPLTTPRRKGSAKIEEPRKGKMQGTLGPEAVSTKLSRIAQLCRNAPRMVLTTLAHHIDMEFMREAYDRTRKDGAVGVDGQRGGEYGASLETNLRSLLERFKSGTYQAPPVRRVYIPKAGGKGSLRPIGIPSFEDKVLQRAVAMVLEAVYEQEFLDCSYGFRPGRGAHQALEALRDELMKMRGGYVLEVDIQSFFDTVEPRHIREFLDKRIRDGVLRRAIDKWLAAGVMEEGQVRHPETGTPQGGVISPLLANLYLHEVLDQWFEGQLKAKLQGQGTLVRYADDAVMVFSCEQDAQRVMKVLPKRFGKFGLTLHPEKTRLLEFKQPVQGGKSATPRDSRQGGSFAFLGLSHYWGRSLKGYEVVKRKTESKRLSRSLKAMAQWCREHRHEPLWWQAKQLASKLRGHFAYYGLPANSKALWGFREAVVRTWRKWLSRRSQRGAQSWKNFGLLLKRYPLPPVKLAVHFQSVAKPLS